MNNIKDVIKRKLSRSDWYLLIANLVPVYGVWFHGWNPKEVFLVYCLETIIIGFYTLLKLLISGMIKKNDVWQNGKISIRQPFWFFMLFFLFHYGMFVAIQMGLFFGVSGLGDQYGISFFNFISKWPSLLTYEAYIMLAVFIASYGIRLISDFIMTEEYKKASLGLIMFQPYGRIFVQQFTVIVGSIFLSFGAGKIFILIFAMVKIFFEVFIDFSSILKKAASGELNTSRK